MALERRQTHEAGPEQPCRLGSAVSASGRTAQQRHRHAARLDRRGLSSLRGRRLFHVTDGSAEAEPDSQRESEPSSLRRFWKRWQRTRGGAVSQAEAAGRISLCSVPLRLRHCAPRGLVSDTSRNGLTVGDGVIWAVHPGGPRIPGRSAGRSTSTSGTLQPALRHSLIIATALTPPSS